MQKPSDLTEEHIIELFEERCSIMEYEANMRRDLAERAAYFDLRKMLGKFVVPDAIKQKLKLTVKENENDIQRDLVPVGKKEARTSKG